MSSIVFATDLSARSDRAFQRAAKLARARELPLYVLNVVDHDLPSTAADAAKESAETLLKEQVAAEDTLRGVDVRIRVLFGEPWQTIPERADAWEAEVVVLGPHRNRGLVDLFLGTTLWRIAKHSPLPLLVVTGPVSQDYGAAVVGVDFSPACAHAARVATRIAPAAKLVLTHAYHVPFKSLTMRVGADGSLPKAEELRIETQLHDDVKALADSLDLADVQVERVVEEGAPMRVLLDTAKAQGAALICVGTHSRPKLVEAVLGSTAEELLSSAPHDVLLVPPSAG